MTLPAMIPIGPVPMIRTRSPIFGGLARIERSAPVTGSMNEAWRSSSSAGTLTAAARRSSEKFRSAQKTSSLTSPEKIGRTERYSAKPPKSVWPQYTTRSPTLMSGLLKAAPISTTSPRYSWPRMTG